MKDDGKFRESIVFSPLSEPIVVQAGPGSGKTTLLIERLKYIIEKRQKNYLGTGCITYTNAAKDEIISRLEKEGVQLPSNLFIGTIHSFLLDFVIKPYSHFFNNEDIPFKLASFGFARNYKNDIATMLKRPPYLINNSTLEAFESLNRDKNGNPFCYRGKIPSDVAKWWKSLLKRDGYIDQQDVVYLSYLILNKYEHIRDALSVRFPYMLVDEYQDVTYFQERLFLLLNHSTFFCVGDSNQSVFGFTGAQPENFKSKWENESYKTYKLSNNFRSAKHIIHLANNKTDIEQVEAGINGTSDQKVVFFKDVEQVSEVIKLFHRIRDNVECDEDYNPYIILARQNKYIRVISNLIKNQDIEPNMFFQKLKKEHYRRYKILYNSLIAILFRRESDFKQAVERIEEAFSYLLFNEHPNFVDLASIGYDKFMWKKLQVYTLQYLDGLVLSETTVAELFEEMKDFISNLSKDLFGIPIGNKLRMLNYNWKNQVKASKGTTISQLVDQLEIESNLSNSEGNVISIHNAKGQEAECVLVLAESKSQLDEWLALNNETEEARVGYVAFSRARKLLCVWAPLIEEEDYAHLDENVTFLDNSYISMKETV
ncbi:Superfamily I DNA or RNA helicase [Amphibacillus marinus]|uniref:DNA 3'-5' helicase n=1 Tax=Amphibacillus marinus TaxID=872970 RepID=A0A1H8L0Z8_9BACI|nr:ATP-dependent helicase [Amphibacillus marinus]SEN98328.1 Superfamily I DNA or RNA helicase [Amphibacillus marinus]